MKNITLKLSIFSMILLSTFLLFNSCENKLSDTNDIDNQIDYSNFKTSLTIDDNIGLTIISQDSTNNIYLKIRNMMDNINLSYNSSDIPFGLALFFDNVIDTLNFNNLKAVVYYFNDNDNRVNVWLDNNGNLEQNQNYSKISHFIANEDLYRLNVSENLNTENVLLILNQSVLPTNQYFSEFQTIIDIEYAAIINPSGGGHQPNDGGRLCDRNPDCAGSPIEGTCAYRENQGGGSRGICTAWSVDDGCILPTPMSILESNNTPLDSAFLPTIYEIRDVVLINDNKLEFLIDDYYYVSTIIWSEITLSIALDIYDLNNTNFLDILRNYNDVNYSDSILISNQNKPILLNICNKSKNLTSDSRTNVIFNNLINKINTYANKTVSYIKNN